ncbi:Os08g0478566, partial [Oryza sativa Japonica Group]
QTTYGTVDYLSLSVDFLWISLVNHPNKDHYWITTTIFILSFIL